MSLVVTVGGRSTRCTTAIDPGQWAATCRAEAEKTEENGERCTEGVQRKKGGKRGGQNKKSDSRRAVAEATGMSPATQVKMERHVAIAEAFPFLQREGCRRMLGRRRIAI
jgi:hypothetical protein